LKEGRLICEIYVGGGKKKKKGSPYGLQPIVD